MSPFELIRAEAASYPVMRLCELLGVSRSGYYEWRERQTETPPPPPHERLSAKLRAFHIVSNGTYGVRRMHRELLADGERVGRRLVRRLMRQNGPITVQARRFRKTTDSDHALGYSPNLLNQDFYMPSPNRAWVSDITYVWTAEGWCYLAVILDLCSRRVVGWAIDSHMKAELCERALSRALSTRGPVKGLILHSDREASTRPAPIEESSSGMDCVSP